MLASAYLMADLDWLSMAAGTCWLLVTLCWDAWALLSAPDPAAAAGHFDLLAVVLAVGFAGQIVIGHSTGRVSRGTGCTTMSNAARKERGVSRWR